MNSEDKLWELKKLEYKRDEMEDGIAYLRNASPDYAEICAGAEVTVMPYLNDQISKLLEDE